MPLTANRAAAGAPVFAVCGFDHTVRQIGRSSIGQIGQIGRSAHTVALSPRSPHSPEQAVDAVFPGRPDIFHAEKAVTRAEKTG